MREIKFRAWENYHNKLCYGYETYISDALKNNYPLMQFTGLKDKNGVDIYEKDLLRTNKGILKVMFHQGSFIIVKTDGNFLKNNDETGFTTWINDCEVIGNIYEHSHLLK